MGVSNERNKERRAGQQKRIGMKGKERRNLNKVVKKELGIKAEEGSK